MTDIFTIPGPLGRAVEVLTGGDPDGVPLLFHGGSPSAATEHRLVDEACRELGLRLVTYSRPGYGASDPRPAAGRYADDVEESTAVLDHLEVDRFLTAGWSGGGPRALACGALLPDRCRAVASIAGVAPYDAYGLRWFEGMAEENHAEYHAAEQGREAYEEYLVADFLPVLAATPDQLAEAMGGLVTPVDVAALTPETTDWLSRNFQRAGAQGVTGVRDDGLAAVAPWGFDLASMAVPVAIWQGRQDAMVPFAHGEWLAARVPGAEAHLLDDEGHISIVTARIREILADLKRLGGV